MLERAKTLLGYNLKGRDGEIGTVKDFYFDDKHWAVRYLIAGTGDWMTGKAVLISPYALQGVHNSTRDISTTLSRAQIEKSPSLDHDKPVSRQFEQNFFSYYGWPTYWSGPYMWGSYPYIDRDPKNLTGTEPEPLPDDPHLHSMAEVDGYHIQAPDGEIGHVDDFIIDGDTWAIRYLVVDTHNWLPGRRVLLSPAWIDQVSWADSKVFVNHSRELVKAAPDYTSEQLLTREYEKSLYAHYKRKGYWTDEMADAVNDA